MNPDHETDPRTPFDEIDYWLDSMEKDKLYRYLTQEDRHQLEMLLLFFMETMNSDCFKLMNSMIEEQEAFETLFLENGLISDEWHSIIFQTEAFCVENVYGEAHIKVDGPISRDAFLSQCRSAYEKEKGDVSQDEWDRLSSYIQYKQITDFKVFSD